MYFYRKETIILKITCPLPVEIPLSGAGQRSPPDADTCGDKY